MFLNLENNLQSIKKAKDTIYCGLNGRHTPYIDSFSNIFLKPFLKFNYSFLTISHKGAARVPELTMTPLFLSFVNRLPTFCLFCSVVSMSGSLSISRSSTSFRFTGPNFSISSSTSYSRTNLTLAASFPLRISSMNRSNLSLNSAGVAGLPSGMRAFLSD